MSKTEEIAKCVRTILECVGEDPDRDGLRKTPRRFAEAFQFFNSGHSQSIESIVKDAIFEEENEEMILVRDIEIFSLCEHHLLPFVGKLHVAYLPNKRVVGLSKLARIAEAFSRRLQIQERMTRDIAQSLMDILKPHGVACVVEAVHYCMVMRGVQKTGATTVTSCLLGDFKRDPKTRQEFMQLVKSKL